MRSGSGLRRPGSGFWTHLDHHQGLAVSAQRVLQQVGEPRVPEGDVGMSAAQRTDDITQRRQRLVDALRFPEPAALRSGLPDPLRTGQVHQVQLP